MLLLFSVRQKEGNVAMRMEGNILKAVYTVWSSVHKEREMVREFRENCIRVSEHNFYLFLLFVSTTFSCKLTVLMQTLALY